MTSRRRSSRGRSLAVGSSNLCEGIPIELSKRKRFEILLRITFEHSLKKVMEDFDIPRELEQDLQDEAQKLFGDFDLPGLHDEMLKKLVELATDSTLICPPLSQLHQYFGKLERENRLWDNLLEAPPVLFQKKPDNTRVPNVNTIVSEKDFQTLALKEQELAMQQDLLNVSVQRKASLLRGALERSQTKDFVEPLCISNMPEVDIFNHFAKFAS